MAITPNDFNKIWSTNASTPAYTFSDADYLEGWDFVGNLPPTRAQWNAIQKRTDEKMKYIFDNFGAPLVANTVADMTEQNRVYVYTGSEVGYTAGDWYYYDAGTSTWVDGGVYNAVAVVTDTTLTQAGVPADAKATGDAIALKPSVDTTLTVVGDASESKTVGDFTDNILRKGVAGVSNDFVVGSLSYLNGSNTAASNRLRTKNYFNGITRAKALTGYAFAIYAYDKTDNSYIGVYSNNGTYTKTNDIKYVSAYYFSPDYNYKIVLKRTDDATITADEATNIVFYKSTDDTLSVGGMSADAKVVGEKISTLQTIGYQSSASKNIFDGVYISGKYIDANGDEASSSNYKCSGFLRLKQGTRRTIYFVTSDNTYPTSGRAFYDADKNYIGSVLISNKEGPISDDAAYVRFYIRAEYTGSVYISTEVPTSPVDFTYKEGYQIVNNALFGLMIEKPTSKNFFYNYWINGFYIDGNNAIATGSQFKYAPRYIKIPKHENRTLYFRRNDSNGNVFPVAYNENFEIIPQGTGFSLPSGSTSLDFPINKDVAYLRAYAQNSFTGDLYISTENPDDVVDYTYTVEKVINNNLVENYTDKKLNIVCFGDSIYGNYRGSQGAEMSVPAIISSMTGYNVVNAGFGGCRMHKHDGSWDAFSMYRLAYAIANNDWTLQEAAGNPRFYFQDVVAVLKALDFSKIDMIVIEYGTNDWASGDSLDDPVNPFNTDTFGGALRYSIMTLLTAYPKLMILVQNPTPRFKMSGSAIVETSDVTVNASGDTLVDLIDKENEICKEYKIPTIDAYYNSGFNIYTHDSYYPSDDGTHLALAGRQRLGCIIANYIKANFNPAP